jgi:hypothetical protein
MTEIEPRDPGLAPGAETDALEALVYADYERCHPGETFGDMKRRAPYSRIDKGLYRAWMAIAAARLAERQTVAGDGTPR